MVDKNARNAYKASAEDWLLALRRGNAEYTFFDHLRRDLKKGKLRLRDIGTCRKELIDLKVMCHKLRAESWLAALRKGTTEHTFHDHLIDDLAKSKLKMEDIGTSKEELDTLQRNTYKLSAEAGLKTLRRGTWEDWRIDNLRSDLKQARLGFKDIGTNRFELAWLRRNCYKISAECYLSALRSGNSQHSCLRNFRTDLKKAGLRLKDIGTDRAEVKTFVISE